MLTASQLQFTANFNARQINKLTSLPVQFSSSTNKTTDNIQFSGEQTSGRRSASKALSLLAAFSLIIAACGSDDEPPEQADYSDIVEEPSEETVEADTLSDGILTETVEVEVPIAMTEVLGECKTDTGHGVRIEMNDNSRTIKVQDCEGHVIAKLNLEETDGDHNIISFSPTSSVTDEIANTLSTDGQGLFFEFTPEGEPTQAVRYVPGEGITIEDAEADGMSNQLLGENRIGVLGSCTLGENAPETALVETDQQAVSDGDEGYLQQPEFSVVQLEPSGIIIRMDGYHDQVLTDCDGNEIAYIERQGGYIRAFQGIPISDELRQILHSQTTLYSAEDNEGYRSVTGISFESNPDGAGGEPPVTVTIDFTDGVNRVTIEPMDFTAEGGETVTQEQTQLTEAAQAFVDSLDTSDGAKEQIRLEISAQVDRLNGEHTTPEKFADRVVEIIVNFTDFTDEENEAVKEEVYDFLDVDVPISIVEDEETE